MSVKRKISKLVLSTALVGTLSLGGLGLGPSVENAYAAEDGPDQYIAYTGYEYDKSSQYTGKKITWSHDHDNSYGTTTDTVTHSVSRTKYTNASVSTSASFDAMVSEVGISYEVGWGSNQTVSTSVTYTIPAGARYTLRYGSRYVKTSGYERYYSRGTLASSKWVNGEWTYRGYSDKVAY
ncbi:hypothetical protein [Bacillus marinisedimentorum]|uniref:hypothetical protein n=1 Tax=Bacillus marinisedimentorum TaxID=1821260 RepID=UPI0008730017|nr:hypothetical protein [Bacillus marinisedimentorum]